MEVASFRSTSQVTPLLQQSTIPLNSTATLAFWEAVEIMPRSMLLLVSQNSPLILLAVILFQKA